jgi:hypothetical protein
MRGNLPTIHLEIFGANMRGAGPLPVVLDWDQTRLEVQDYCYLYEKPFAEGQRHGCASWGNASDTYGEIIGLRVEINVVHGATPAVKTLWIGGVPVSFDLRLPDLPKEEEKEATIVQLLFTTPKAPFAPIDGVAFGDRFRVKVVFSADPSRDHEPITLSGEDPNATITVNAVRTDDRRVYLTGAIVVDPPQTTGTGR